MKTEQINLRLDADIVSALERVASAESTDRATAIRRLLETSLRQWELQHAIDEYRRGDVSLGRAAEEAGLSQWELQELLRRERIAYPLDVEELSARLLELGTDTESTEERTLPDVPPQPGGVLLVGINPALVSVAAGHYYQGRLGQRLWRRLERLGLLVDPVPGREDESFAEAGHGLTDLVKRPTRSATDVSKRELEAGVETLKGKIQAWRPGLVLFAFKQPARVLLGPGVKPGLGRELEGVRTFLLTGPYAPTGDAQRIDAELGELLGAEDSLSSDYEPTQTVTPRDLERGQIRLKQPARRFFPSGKKQVEILLRGERIEARYDPKLGLDRPRSPLLRIDRRRLRNAVRPNEQLRVSRGLAGVVRID
jgi:TDG/mug DNA glycosylase family protein